MNARDIRHESMRIAGDLVGGDRVIEVRNPYTGAVVGTVPKASSTTCAGPSRSRAPTGRR